MRSLAVLDAALNSNSDRKGSHCLRATWTVVLWAIDHGVTFSRRRSCAPCCGAGRVNRSSTSCASSALRRALEASDVRDRLLVLLPEADVDALMLRVARLIDRGVHPIPAA